MSNDTIKKLKDVWDIVSEVQKHVHLTKRGQNFVGLCPFHSEKTPSFYVSPLKKIFHCFGCGENGDVISFMMKIENLSFKEVVLEKATEFQIPHEFSQNENVRHELDELRDFLNQLQVKYTEWFKQNGPVNHYCQERKLSQDDIHSFGLGFSSTGSVQQRWINDTNLKQLANKSGLFNDQGFPLLFERLMFPIHNPRGILVGFSGRVLTSENKAKYINSPESTVFSKKKLLYAMHIAKKQAKETKRLIIVEGYMDVISMHHHGFKETVAVMGTALTEFHAKELAKYTSNIVLLFDSDSAGQSAVLKSLPALQKEKLNIQIATLKEKDPGDFFINQGVDQMKAVLLKAKHYMDHYIDLYYNQTIDNDPTKKSEIVNALSQLLINEKNQIVVDHYVKTIAQQFDVSQNIITSYVKSNDIKPIKATQISFKTSSKYKKSEEMILCFLITNIEFRKKHIEDIIEIVPIIQENELKSFFLSSTDIDYEFIEKINHSEIKKYLLSLVIKFTEINFTYKLNEMEEYLHLLKQGKFNERVNEIKQLLGNKQGNIEQEKELLIELSELIKKIK